MKTETRRYLDLFETGLSTWKIACMCDVDESEVYNALNQLRHTPRGKALPYMSEAEHVWFTKMVRYLGMPRDDAIAEVLKARDKQAA